MPGFTLAAVASIAAGLSIGAAATVGVTLVVAHGSMAPTQGVPVPVVSTVVQYGDRCFSDYCPPACGTTTACLNAGLHPEDRHRKP